MIRKLKITLSELYDSYANNWGNAQSRLWLSRRWLTGTGQEGQEGAAGCPAHPLSSMPSSLLAEDSPPSWKLVQPRKHHGMCILILTKQNSLKLSKSFALPKKTVFNWGGAQGGKSSVPSLLGVGVYMKLRLSLAHGDGVWREPRAFQELRPSLGEWRETDS